MATDTNEYFNTVTKMIHNTIKLMVGFSLFDNISQKYLLRYSYLWIESPEETTIMQMPFYQALRIIRKHNWSLAPVIPIRYRNDKTERIAYINRDGE